MVTLDQCFDSEGASKLSVTVLPQLEYDPASNLAQVFLGDGWSYVNRGGEIVLRRVLSFDNGAEPFKDGRLRVVVNGKYGFADATGAVVIPATYDGAFAFDNGHAPVCVGCVTEESGEYKEIVGGKWSCIDTSGKSVDEKKCESADVEG